MRSPAAPAARRRWRRWSGATSSWCRWTRCARWWRYHHLFADLLRVRLQQEQPGRVAVLHHRAAAAWSRGTRPRPTTPSGTRSPRVTPLGRAAGGASSRRTAAAQRRVTLDSWLAALPAELVDPGRDCCWARSSSRSSAARWRWSTACWTLAERAAARVADEPYEPSVGRAASVVSNVRATTALARAYHAELRGAPETQIAFGRRALAEVGEGELTLRAIIRGHLGVAEWLRGDLRESERAWPPASPNCARSASASWRCGSASTSARCGGPAVDLDAASAGYQQAMEIAAPPDQKPLPAAGIVHVRMAEVAYQRNRSGRGAAARDAGHRTLPAARLRAGAGHRVRHAGVDPPAAGDAAGAEDAAEEARRCAPSSNVASVLNPVPTQLARLQLAQGDVAGAAGWTRHRGD